jgi:hypothetical protein
MGCSLPPATSWHAAQRNAPPREKLPVVKTAVTHALESGRVTMRWSKLLAFSIAHSASAATVADTFVSASIGSCLTPVASASTVQESATDGLKTFVFVYEVARWVVGAASPMTFVTFQAPPGVEAVLQKVAGANAKMVPDANEGVNERIQQGRFVVQLGIPGHRPISSEVSLHPLYTTSRDASAVGAAWTPTPDLPAASYAASHFNTPGRRAEAVAIKEAPTFEAGTDGRHAPSATSNESRLPLRRRASYSRVPTSHTATTSGVSEAYLNGILTAPPPPSPSPPTIALELRGVLRDPRPLPNDPGLPTNYLHALCESPSEYQLSYATLRARSNTSPPPTPPPPKPRHLLAAASYRTLPGAESYTYDHQQLQQRAPPQRGIGFPGAYSASIRTPPTSLRGGSIPLPHEGSGFGSAYSYGALAEAPPPPKNLGVLLREQELKREIALSKLLHEQEMQNELDMEKLRGGRSPGGAEDEPLSALLQEEQLEQKRTADAALAARQRAALAGQRDAPPSSQGGGSSGLSPMAIAGLCVVSFASALWVASHPAVKAKLLAARSSGAVTSADLNGVALEDGTRSSLLESADTDDVARSRPTTRGDPRGARDESCGLLPLAARPERGRAEDRRASSQRRPRTQRHERSRRYERAGSSSGSEDGRGTALSCSGSDSPLEGGSAHSSDDEREPRSGSRASRASSPGAARSHEDSVRDSGSRRARAPPREPPREPSRREASRLDEPRRNEPRRDGPRRDGPRRDEPRRDGPRRDERAERGGGRGPAKDEEPPRRSARGEDGSQRAHRDADGGRRSERGDSSRRATDQPPPRRGALAPDPPRKEATSKSAPRKQVQMD